MQIRTVVTILLAFFLSACWQAANEDGGEDNAASTFVFHGEFSIEERIAKYPTVVRASLIGTSSEVVEGRERFAGKYAMIVKFRLRVDEYLNGSGASTITAVWGATRAFDSRSDAEAELPKLVKRRDTQWDDREAIIFLQNETWDLFCATEGTDTYYLTSHNDFVLDDGYTLHSRKTKLWLPSAATSTSGGGTRRAYGDDKEFLLALPESSGGASGSSRPGRFATSTSSTLPRSAGGSTSGSTQTITVGSLKTKIAAINAEIAAGANTPEYRYCIGVKHGYERMVEWGKSVGRPMAFRDSVKARIEGHTIPSGAPAGTAQFMEDMIGNYPNDRTRTWLEGGDAALFEVTYGPNRNEDWDNDGQLTAVKDAIWYTQSLRTIRPLPSGEYAFDLKDVSYTTKLCNDIITTPWTVTVAEHERTLHEALFDPVTDGSAVAADSSNGQLDPAAFTDANGASATIQRIEWASDTVKVKVSPHTGLAGYKLDFIELDGSVSLSLQVDNATVDAANKTLSWTVSEQPWEDGDKLMLRIAEVVPEVALVNVPATITQGQTASVTVRATDLSSSNSYTVRLAANSFAIGFNNICLYGSKTVVVPSGSASHSATIPLQGCHATSSTVTANLKQGTSTVATATAEVEVEASTNVTVTLSPREEQYGTYTNLAVQWNDPSGCVGRYYVGIFNSQETVVNNLGYHPAPATTSLSQNLGRSWDDIPNLDWFVKVRCHASDPSRMTIVGQASLQSGLPSTP